MRERLIDGLIQGDRLTWAAYGALWALTTLLVLLHRPPDPQRRAGSPFAFAWALLAITTGTSLAGLPLAAALAVPRVRWKAVDAPDLLATNGETWRKLRGPGVALPGPEPEFAVPTVDASDRWVLTGLLSGKPVPGLPAAEATAAAPGAPRLCKAEGTGCRAWPVAWPDPARSPPLGELDWIHGTPGTPPGALAYDVETGLYLVHVEPAPALVGEPEPALAAGPRPTLELVGRASAEPMHDGAAVLFAVRSVAGGRLHAARIAASPDPARPGAHVFHLHRAGASLTAAPRMFAWVARPLLSFTSAALPLGLLVHLLAPLFLRVRRRDASRADRRVEVAARVGPWLEAAAAFGAGLAAAAPALVAMANLWGSR